jgi:hypothetical protein
LRPALGPTRCLGLSWAANLCAPYCCFRSSMPTIYIRNPIFSLSLSHTHTHTFQDPWRCPVTTPSAGCFQCLSKVADGNNFVITMDFSGCKNSAISWACCLGSGSNAKPCSGPNYNSALCESCSSATCPLFNNQYPKCEGVSQAIWTVPNTANSVVINTHDGTAQGQGTTRNYCARSGGGSCDNPFCLLKVDITNCPSPAPSPTPPVCDAAKIQSCRDRSGPCGNFKCNDAKPLGDCVLDGSPAPRDTKCSHSDDPCGVATCDGAGFCSVTGSAQADGAYCINELCQVGCCSSGTCQVPTKDPVTGAVTPGVCAPPPCAVPGGPSCSAKDDTCVRYSCVGYTNGYDANAVDADGCLAAPRSPIGPNCCGSNNDISKCTDTSSDCMRPWCDAKYKCHFDQPLISGTKCDYNSTEKNGCCDDIGNCQVGDICKYVSAVVYTLWVRRVGARRTTRRNSPRSLTCSNPLSFVFSGNHVQPPRCQRIPMSPT